MMRSISTSAALRSGAERDVWRLSDGNAQLVADCIKAMRDVVSIPVTVKTRIGIDDRDSEFLCDFIETVSGKGECEMFIIHARKPLSV